MLKLRFGIGSLSLTAILAWFPVLHSQAAAVELVGRAVLPSDTFAPGPTSGQLITGDTNGRTVPFKNQQPVQGFSAVLPGPKPGTFLVLVDNGFGAKANSADSLLRFYAVEPDFSTGQVLPVNLNTGARLKGFTSESWLQLNDKNKQADFAIVADQQLYPGSITPSNSNGIPLDPAIKSGHLLTGADFDLESFRQIEDGTYWLGEEFGPYLLHIAADGTLLEAPISTPNTLKLGSLPFVQSPDNPAFANLAAADRVKAANLPSSRGFEGMALNASGDKLYTLLEGPLVPEVKRDRLLINVFDLAAQKYTDRVFSYRLEAAFQAIGDMTAINDHEFIVIERDNGQGNASNPVFANPAKSKKLYKIDISKIDSEGFVEKKLLADLLNIPDPKGLGGTGTTNGVFTFPFVTIEDVLPIDNRTLLVMNDNNYPFSAGRTPGQSDGSEFVLLRLDQPLMLQPRKQASTPEPGTGLALALGGLGAMVKSLKQYLGL